MYIFLRRILIFHIYEFHVRNFMDKIYIHAHTQRERERDMIG